VFSSSGAAVIAQTGVVALEIGVDFEGWYDLTFAEPVEIEEDSYRLGLHGGPAGTALGPALRYRDTGAQGMTGSTDAFADGTGPIAAPAVSARAPQMFASMTPHWAPPVVSDLELARLAFPSAQRALAGSLPAGEAALSATLEWHGTTTDGDRGSIALVNAAGPLGDLVGERIGIRRSRARAPVFVYVKGTEDLDEDLSVSRRVFGALGDLGDTRLDVLVEVVR
ncbi:MAG TPA: hypothetical protein VK595_00500, partial [Vicinamibacterales bacterium]|nr:hypothetical protein [Vicinamibacterales bacterium]